MANPDSAMILAKRAIQAEPLYSIPYTHYGYANTYKKNCAVAIEYCQKAFVMDSSNFLTRHALAQAYSCSGRYQEAIKVLKPSEDPTKLHDWLLINLTYAYMKTGQKEKAMNLFREAQRRDKQGTMLKTHLGMIAANVHLDQLALQYFAKAMEIKEGMLMLSKNFLMMDHDFQHSTEYLKLMSPLNLPDLTKGLN